MLPKRFVESSCLKCHHEVTDVPQAKKLQAGYQRIVKYGCTGCHTIGGEGSFGPDLTDEPAGGPEPLARRLEGLEGVDRSSGSSTRTPSGPTRGCPGSTALTNNDGTEDWPKNYAEANAIAALPLRQEHASPPASSTRPPRPTPPRARSCSSRRAAWPATSTGPTSRTRSRRPTGTSINPDYKPDAAATYDPQNFPATVRSRPRTARSWHGRLRPQPLEHRGQVPVASPRATSGWPTGSTRPRSTIPGA